MTRDQAQEALKTLSTAPSAKWIGNRLLDDGARLLQKCTRCGAEETLEMPPAAVEAYKGGARGSSLARVMPIDFDAKLYAWKRQFQTDHARCIEDGVS